MGAWLLGTGTNPQESKNRGGFRVQLQHQQSQPVLAAWADRATCLAGAAIRCLSWEEDADQKVGHGGEETAFKYRFLGAGGARQERGSDRKKR